MKTRRVFISILTLLTLSLFSSVVFAADVPGSEVDVYGVNLGGGVNNVTDTDGNGLASVTQRIKDVDKINKTVDVEIMLNFEQTGQGANPTPGGPSSTVSESVDGTTAATPANANTDTTAKTSAISPAPQTGDSFPIFLFIFAGAALILAIGLLVFRKKKKAQIIGVLVIATALFVGGVPANQNAYAVDSNCVVTEMFSPSLMGSFSYGTVLSKTSGDVTLLRTGSHVTGIQWSPAMDGTQVLTYRLQLKDRIDTQHLYEPFAIADVENVAYINAAGDSKTASLPSLSVRLDYEVPTTAPVPPTAE